MSPKYAFMVCAVILGVIGCQSYQRQPLDLTDYASQWAARSLNVEAVGTYAASLADAADSPAPFDSKDGLSLNEAEAVALHFNPQLLIARSQADVPLAGAEEAGWWPDPDFQVQVLRYYWS